MALWTIAQVAAWASLTEGAARKKLDQLKVPYYDFGRGRGLGRRWDEDEVKDAFNSLRSDRKTKAAPRPRRFVDPFDRPMSQVIKELTGWQPQEKKRSTASKGIPPKEQPENKD
jgi:hypothetical protein